MRRIPHMLAVGATAISLLALGLTFEISDASAAGTLPGTVNEVVAATASLSAVGCPTSLATAFPSASTFTSLEAAVAAATNGQTIYVCAGLYDMTAYPNGQVDIPSGLGITIDGYNWDSPPSGSDTSSSVDSTTQSEFANGAGILVQSSADVTISGLTFYENNAVASNMTQCGGHPCGTSIDVQSLIGGVGGGVPGDQGESNVTISNNLFVNTGAGSDQVGTIHFGLGGFIEDENYETNADTTALDANDVVEGNVFVQDQGYENNGLEMDDTTGALVTGNTVTYPLNNGTGADDAEYSAISFPGFDQATTITNNTLNGGGMFSDSGSVPDTTNPKSGIKVEDVYGDGCGNQTISGNTISGFVYDIDVQSSGNTLDTDTLCAAPTGPTDFTVSGNTLSDSRIYGINVSAGATYGLISDNVTSDTDSEGYTPDSYTPGEYDYFDGAPSATTNTWTNDTGNGTSDPSDLETTTTTTSPPPAPATTTTTTTTTTTPTTTTTNPPKPSISVLGVTLTAGDKVRTTLHCALARCVGKVEITKSVKSKVVVIGIARYAQATGTQRQLSIHLNATGVKLLNSTNGRRFTCTLTLTSAGETKREIVSLYIP
ncbi:MAG: right-handed parallel beta-helix repeat-containing protein [Acidimicrobiales bacterium]